MTTDYVLLIVVATAVLSSMITLGVGFVLLRTSFDNKLHESIERFKQEVGAEVEFRVKKGVVEGIKSLPSKDVLKDTTMSLAKTSLDIFGDGLKMATRPRRPTSPDDEQ